MDKQEEEEAFKVQEDSPHPSFIEVVCKSSGKVRRFAPGTDAAFALNLINKNLLVGNTDNTKTTLASHIEAVKPGEEPISFGPTAPLLSYPPPWILQTVVETQSHASPLAKGQPTHKPKKHVKGSEGNRSAKKTSQPLGLLYFGKILLALLMIFVIGAIFTLALENLPTLLLYINSNM